MLRSASLLAPRGHFVTALQRSDFSWRRPSATERLGPYSGRTFTGKQSEVSLGTHGVVLGIPACLDRLIQQALLQVLTPIFDPDFSVNSYGFRTGKRAHDAVRAAQRYIAEGYTWVVDMDLAQFFDRVNHDILMARVAKKVHDKRVLLLIRRYLESGVMIGGS